MPKFSAPPTQVFDAERDFGFVGDLQTVYSGVVTLSITSGANVLTVSNGPFVPTDVGKRITIARAGAGGTQLTTTITGYTSATVVTLGANAGSTHSAAIVGVSWGTDNTAACAKMVSTVNASNGCKVVFGNTATNSWGIPVRMAFNDTCQIEGVGGGYTSDRGDYYNSGGTRLAWWGTTVDDGVDFGAMISFAPPVASPDPDRTQSLKRVSLRHLWLDCRNNDQNQALIGLKLVSCHGWSIEDFMVMDGLAIGLWCDVLAPNSTGATQAGEAKDTTRFVCSNICVRMLGSQPINPGGGAVQTTPVTTTSASAITTSATTLGGVGANTLPAAGYAWVQTQVGQPCLIKYTGGGGTATLTGVTTAAENVFNAPTTISGCNIVQAVPGNGCGIYLNGSSGGTAPTPIGANTCMGTFNMVQINHGTTWGPAGLENGNSDSIVFSQFVVNGGNVTNDGVINRIRKPGVRVNGSNTNQTLASRNHVFLDGDPGAGGVSAMGWMSNGTTRMIAMSGPTIWQRMQLGNGAPVPNVEGNAYFDWSPNGGWLVGQRGSTAVADQAPLSTVAEVTINGSTITVPPQGFQVGTVFRWTVWAVAGGLSGTAVLTIRIRVGSTFTSSDPVIATIVYPAATTATTNIPRFKLDTDLTIRGPLGASCAAASQSLMSKSFVNSFGGGALTAMAVTTMATFNSSVGQAFVYMSASLSATTPTLIVNQCTAEIVNSANP